MSRPHARKAPPAGVGPVFDATARRLLRTLLDSRPVGGPGRDALPPGLRGPTVRLLTWLSLEDDGTDAYLAFVAAERGRRGLGPDGGTLGPPDFRLLDLARDGYAALTDAELHRLVCSPTAFLWVVTRLHGDPDVGWHLGRWFFEPASRRMS